MDRIVALLDSHVWAADPTPWPVWSANPAHLTWDADDVVRSYRISYEDIHNEHLDSGDAFFRTAADALVGQLRLDALALVGRRLAVTAVALARPSARGR